MIARSPKEAVELLDRAFNEGDVETLLTFYEDAAVVVTGPGHLAPLLAAASLALVQLWSF